ncbi:heparinase II/III-family protein [Jeotgalibaca sp. MA1X17-3]|uniref:heparinase II/III domain-containing protein n=1 Tax=Jeotgalibaca sp. MA1X17-3 TaxID=2908211 RepID=UPI001F1689D1|nr:heparinase II/III family protein [Jeotgalibaca sp. MA1X17-3]UJF15713.1 heparinase II/III-family protein [Jeotgalibaca sp. MA1X17-3]
MGKLFIKIISATYERGELPLSKPCYFENDLSLEQLLFVPEINKVETVEPNRQSVDMEKSNYALLKNERIDVFYKYGHNGPSHAHPDKMTIEVMLNDQTLTRDLSNSGYGSVVCNEWHRRSSSHNTVMVDGQDQTSFLPGQKLSFSDTKVNAKAEDVYEGVDFEREISLNDQGFNDLFMVSSNKEHVYDNFFHVESTLLTDLNDLFTVVKNADLGYQENGYSYFKNIQELVPKNAEEMVTLTWQLGEQQVISTINLKDSQLFIADSPSNPISEWRTSIIVRQKSQNARFEMSWMIQQ